MLQSCPILGGILGGLVGHGEEDPCRLVVEVPPVLPWINSQLAAQTSPTPMGMVVYRESMALGHNTYPSVGT